MTAFYKGKKILVTGHSGFKGSWLVAVLQQMGAEIFGYALAPGTNPNHLDLLAPDVDATYNNILQKDALHEFMQHASPEIIFHLAAQPLVRESYRNPLNTYETNVIGTLNVLEAARTCHSVRAIVCITTDKVYENKEIEYAYTEDDQLGGYDMYSSSKACCEILIASYRNSFFNMNDYGKHHNMLIASARAGNVIGGGDWSSDRLIPDIVRSTVSGQKVEIRNPSAIRPWQHVLDCIFGYLLMATKLFEGDTQVASAWNFSPSTAELMTVEAVLKGAKQHWPQIEVTFNKDPDDFHEANLLMLDNSKAVHKLGWQPAWTTADAIEKTIKWYRAFYEEGEVLTNKQIANYISAINKTA
ncbi:MAG: ddhB [Ferruginibacter sp.]|nr:ddhB [Ferruginibacter sp.]